MRGVLLLTLKQIYLPVASSDNGVSRTVMFHGDFPCPPQALQNRNLDVAFALVLWAQLFAYILINLPNVLETRGQALVSAVVYFALCSAPAWAGFRSRGGEHAVQRSRALVLTNIAVSLLMLLWGFDLVIAPTSFMRVGGRAGEATSFTGLAN